MRMTTETTAAMSLTPRSLPDGRYLAYVSGPSEREVVRVRQLATGSDVEVLPPQATLPSGLTFSPDGNYLFFQRREPGQASYSALYQIPSLGGAPRRRAGDVDAAISFAPDGRHVCFPRHNPIKKQYALIVLDLESGRERSWLRSRPRE